MHSARTLLQIRVYGLPFDNINFATDISVSRDRWPSKYFSSTDKVPYYTDRSKACEHARRIVHRARVDWQRYWHAEQDDSQGDPAKGEHVDCHAETTQREGGMGDHFATA